MHKSKGPSLISEIVSNAMEAIERDREEMNEDEEEVDANEGF